MEAMQKALAGLDGKSAEEEEEEARIKEIEDMLAKIEEKHNMVRQLLAQRNLQIASTVRLIDDVPTRTELMQYERRFVELYQQVAMKLEETRKYYATYNTLDSTRGFLAKEVKLIDSITNSFGEAMATKSSQEEFLTQFTAIVDGVEQSLKKQDAALAKKREMSEQKEKEHQGVVEEQRRYFRLVKEFQEECTKNEMLAGRAAELNIEV
jgi:hypothetical protein